MLHWLRHANSSVLITADASMRFTRLLLMSSSLLAGLTYRSPQTFVTKDDELFLTPGAFLRSTRFVSMPSNSATMAWKVHCSSSGVTGSSRRSSSSTSGAASPARCPKSNSSRSSLPVRCSSERASFSHISLPRWYLFRWCNGVYLGFHQFASELTSSSRSSASVRCSSERASFSHISLPRWYLLHRCRCVRQGSCLLRVFSAAAAASISSPGDTGSTSLPDYSRIYEPRRHGRDAMCTRFSNSREPVALRISRRLSGSPPDLEAAPQRQRQRG